MRERSSLAWIATVLLFLAPEASADFVEFVCSKPDGCVFQRILPDGSSGPAIRAEMGDHLFIDPSEGWQIGGGWVKQTS